MSKRPAGTLSGLVEEQKKSARLDEQRSRRSQTSSNNPFLSRPVNPEDALKIFLWTARSKARECVPREMSYPITKPFCEIEARIGILFRKSTFGGESDMRVLSSGPKKVPFRGNEMWMSAFDCTPASEGNRMCNFEGGISKTNFVNWTSSGLSEPSPISSAFGLSNNMSSADLKRELKEEDQITTVYGGYSNHNRACFDGIHAPGRVGSGKFEHKSKLVTMDIALPASPYDLRLGLSTERILDANLKDTPTGWTSKRLKRRKSFARRDNKFAWQLDVTEVTTTDYTENTRVEYEVEIELNQNATLKLINETEEAKVKELCISLAQQLWWMLRQINPVSDVLDVEDFLMDHPDPVASQLALAQCGALKNFMDSKRRGNNCFWESPISEDGNSTIPTASMTNIRFPGCMPVNFSRNDIEKVQRSDENGGYFLSEKTDGVRHFMIFTGKTVVLVDRAMKTKQPKARNSDDPEPMSSVIPLVKPGTVFDGEIVMHRKLRRPIFIVFDVLCLSSTEPILHLTFQERLRHLKKASFRTPSCNRDMFSDAAVKDLTIPLPLVRKNFVGRMELDDLLSHVIEEPGHRTYKNGDTHNHLTDGIIFQPNSPYVCGTDVNLLKWKYLDTVTIDVQIMPPEYFRRNDESTWCVAVSGENDTFVDMTRFIHLPKSELRRLEADKAESGGSIAEVGLEPSTGEWYYLTMRPDKIVPNHISTVLGTLLELAESLGTEELRYRMSVPLNSRDNYRKDIRRMQNQLLDFQRKSNKELLARR